MQKNTKKNYKDATHETIEKNYVHKGFFDVYIETIGQEKNTSKQYTVVTTKAAAAAILGRTEEGKFLIIREYRYPVKKTLYSIPGGRVEQEEQLELAAQREMLEETGYKASSIRFLCMHNPMPSVCDQTVHIFYAENCKKIASTSLDPLEIIEPILLNKKQLLQIIADQSSLVDSILSTALLCLLVSEGS